MAKKTKAPRVWNLVCERSGLPIEYNGVGRPPKFHPSVLAEIEKERRAARYIERQRREGKSVVKKPRRPKVTEAEAIPHCE